MKSMHLETSHCVVRLNTFGMGVAGLHFSLSALISLKNLHRGESKTKDKGSMEGKKLAEGDSGHFTLIYMHDSDLLIMESHI